MALTKIGSIGINTGIAFAGVTTIVTLNTANDALSIGATVNVGSGITLGASGDIFATGVSTFSGNLKVGSGVTISPDGDGFFTGVVTATSFKGAATNLTSIPAANLTGTLPAISGANLTNLDASDLASGTVPTARLGSGTASSSTFLRGDSTFAAVTSTTINNNANNRVITGSGTANTLEAEASLTYNAQDTLSLDHSATNENSYIKIAADDNRRKALVFDSGGTTRGVIGVGDSDEATATSLFLSANSNVAGNSAHMIIDSSGRVLIGTDSTHNANSYSNNLIIYENGDTGMSILGNNSNSNYSSLYFSDTSTASRAFFEVQLGSDGNFTIGTNGTGPIRFTNSGGERVRIDGSGRLKIGTTATPTQSGAVNVFGTDSNTSQISIRRGSNDDGAPKIHFQKSRNTTDGSHTVVQSGDVLGQIVFAGNDGAGPENGARIGCEIDAAPGSNDMPGRLVFETTPDGSDTLVERMRISASGAVSIGNYGLDGVFFNVGEPNVTDGHSIYLRGNTSSSNSNNRVLNCDLHGFYRQSYGQSGFRFRNKDSVSHNRSARVHLYLNDDDTEVGSIMLGASGSAFNTSSDYRLKENEVLISDGITRLKQLKPYRFNFKITPSVTQDGFFAHEVSPIVPEAVTGEKDAMVPNAWYQEGDTIPSGKSVGDIKGYSSTEKEIQSLDYAKITPLLTAALQEAVTKIETLESKVAALEGS